MQTTSIDEPARVATTGGTASKKPNRTGKSIQAYIDPEVRDAVDDYIESNELQPTLTTVLELALKEFLAKRGGWPRQGKAKRRGRDA